MEEVFTMSTKELKKLKVLSQLQEKKITQAIAAKQLEVTDRQIRNLLKQLNEKGEKGLISKKRGKPGNHHKPLHLQNEAVNIVNSLYSDFGPKLANEYLKNKHQIFISDETLRQWMISAKIWFPKAKRNNMHPPRERRRSFGELIQIDGSHHDWFEDRGPPCVLMVYIDDATSEITSLYFAQTETLEAYYQALKRHLDQYGIPLSMYGDRCSVLTPRSPKDAQDTTQFQKALKELGCGLILAYSAQAKGRVERANRTLQDRLVKFLRLRGICSIEEGNKVLEEYRQEHNLYFSKKPSEHMDAHRALDGISVEQILCTRATRTLGKNSTVQFENTFYQILAQDACIHLYPKGKVEIRVCLDGTKRAFFKNKRVSMVAISEVEVPIFTEKEIVSWVPKKVYTPPKSHPYKTCYKQNKKTDDKLRQVV